MKDKDLLWWSHKQFSGYFLLGAVFGGTTVYSVMNAFQAVWDHAIISGVVAGFIAFHVNRGIKQDFRNLGLDSSDETESEEK